jgi:hypothetical protein
VLDGLMNGEKISDESGERYGILSLAKDPNRDCERNALLGFKMERGKNLSADSARPRRSFLADATLQLRGNESCV